MNLLYCKTLSKGLTFLSVQYIFLKAVMIILSPLGYSEDAIRKCVCACVSKYAGLQKCC